MAAAKPTRRDTRLEAEGAEFLVLGSLLAEGIPSWKAYSNFPGYDILAGDINEQRICRIQVKSRYVTGAGGFPIGNFDCDFVCFVRLNRGSRRALRQGWRPNSSATVAEQTRVAPEIYVLPIRVVKRAWVPGAPFGRGGVLLKNIPNHQRYLHAFDQVIAFLRTPQRSRARQPRTAR